MDAFPSFWGKSGIGEVGEDGLGFGGVAGELRKEEVRALRQVTDGCVDGRVFEVEIDRCRTQIFESFSD